MRSCRRFLNETRPAADINLQVTGVQCEGQASACVGLTGVLAAAAGCREQYRRGGDGDGRQGTELLEEAAGPRAVLGRG